MDDLLYVRIQFCKVVYRIAYLIQNAEFNISVTFFNQLE